MKALRQEHVRGLVASHRVRGDHLDLYLQCSSPAEYNGGQLARPNFPLDNKISL